MSIRQREGAGDGDAGNAHRLVVEFLEDASRDRSPDASRPAGAAVAPGPEGPLARAVEAAARLVGARYAAVGLAGAPDRHIEVVVHTGEEPGDVVVVRSPPASSRLDALLRPAHGGRPTLPGAPLAADQLIVPIASDGVPLGFLALAAPDPPGEFSSRDGEVARALAATIGLRIEQERECERQRRRADRLAASLRITSDLATGESAEVALRAITELARESSGADAAWIRGGTAAGDQSLVAVSRGADVPARADGRPDDLSRRAAERASVERERGDDQLTLVVPLASPLGLAGSLTMAWSADRRDDFEAVPADLPESLAEHAMLALEVARARELRDRLQVLEERDRIARDLHDVVLQDLFASVLQVQALARGTDDPQASEGLELAADELRTASRNIRRSVFGLGVGDPGNDPRAEVARVVQRASATLKLEVQLEVRGPLESVGPDVAVDLVAVLGEALSNATQHASAGSVSVEIEVADDAGSGVRLTVVDDGVGVATNLPLSGLRNMRQRAERYGGHLSVGPAPEGGGTRLVWAVRLPA